MNILRMPIHNRELSLTVAITWIIIQLKDFGE